MPVRKLWPPMSPRRLFAQEATNHPEAAVAAPARATVLGPYLRETTSGIELTKLDELYFERQRLCWDFSSGLIEAIKRSAGVSMCHVSIYKGRCRVTS